MRMMEMAAAGAALALAGCAASGEADRPDAVPPPQGQCDAKAAQALIGQQASADTGQRLLALSGARQLRWAPPDSVLTMDFRADRLTVSYDRALRIERITCG